jgi:hypothetical protein
MKAKYNPYAALFEQLKGCDIDERPVTVQLLESSWKEAIETSVNPKNPSPAVMASLVLSRPEFRQLLSPTRAREAETIVMEAIQEYVRLTKPNHDTGRKLADAIAEAQNT